MTETVPGNGRYVTAVQALKVCLQARYGAALHRVVVFGSVARHTAHADSDYDVDGSRAFCAYHHSTCYRPSSYHVQGIRDK